jgi:hypothetical protein
MAKKTLPVLHNLPQTATSMRKTLGRKETHMLVRNLGKKKNPIIARMHHVICVNFMDV